MKKMNKFGAILIVLMVIGGASTFGAHVNVQESNLIISDDFATSYQVMPTAQVVDFLGSYGIDANGMDGDISRAIDQLRKVDLDTDSWDTAKDQLNYLVNSALFAAQREGYEAVYMEIGGSRWLLYPSADDE